MVTLEGFPYSGTQSWVKLVGVPESPPLGLCDTVPGQPYSLLQVTCYTFEMSKCPEVVTRKSLRSFYYD